MNENENKIEGSGIVEKQTLKDIAESIRTKGGGSEEMYPSEFANAIKNIPTSGGSSVTISDNPDGGVDLTVNDSTKTLAKEEDLSQLPTDVQIKGTSILDGNKVANIPVANRTGRAGVSYFPTWSGITVDENGQAYLEDATAVRIATRNTYNPITCYSLDLAVKSAMCDGKGAEWTEAEKASARARIGIITLTQEEYDLIEVKNENTIYIIVE